MSPDESNEEKAGFFSSTEWSLALAVARGSTAEAEEALAKLCGAYWSQIYVYLRRKGYSVPESEDLTQSFFVRMLEKNFLQEADPGRGRFRSFLLSALKHFLANEWDRERAQKRGGRHQIISLEEIASSEDRFAFDLQTLNPEEQLERQWALTTLHRAITLLGEEYARMGKERLFELLRDFLTGVDARPYKMVAAALEMSEGAVKTAVHRLRGRLGALLRSVIEESLPHRDDPREIDEEIRFILKALS
jgi:RNA polymerase sigma-70 factor (ECF subfamily)